MIVALLAGDPRHGARQPPAGDPGHARAADRRRAGGRDDPRDALRAASRRGRGADRGRRLRGALLRALRARSRHDADPHLDGPRRPPRLHGRRALLVTSRPPARGRPRLARDADRRDGRLARARQLAAQPAANRVDRVGADDRSRARDARRDARGGDRQLVRGAPSTTSSPATTRSPPRTTSRRSRSPRPTRPQSPRASRRWATSAPARRASSTRRSSRRQSTRGCARSSRWTGSKARRRSSRRWATTARSPTTATPTITTSGSAPPCP